MKTVTIFEGPDGSGKTTLVDHLSKKLGPDFKVINHGPYPGEAQIAHYYRASLMETERHHVFLDRCWLAEPIYGAAFRGGADRVGVASRRMLDRIALGRDGVVVLCRPPYEKCRETFVQRKGIEYLDTPEQLNDVYRRYGKMVTDLPVVCYDYTNDNMDDVIDRVVKARGPVNTGPGIGHWDPGHVTLMVGDRMNGKPGDPLSDLPFVSFNEGGCSAWLARGLESASVPEDELYWINAFDRNGDATWDDFVGELSPKKVIALGENAAAWCAAAGVKYSRVQHPQFWKRFRSSEHYPLFSLLEEVI